MSSAHLKSEAAELDRKIALTLAPPEEQEEAEKEMNKAFYHKKLSKIQ